MRILLSAWRKWRHSSKCLCCLPALAWIQRHIQRYACSLTLLSKLDQVRARCIFGMMSQSKESSRVQVQTVLTSTWCHTCLVEFAEQKLSRKAWGKIRLWYRSSIEELRVECLAMRPGIAWSDAYPCCHSAYYLRMNSVLWTSLDADFWLLLQSFLVSSLTTLFWEAQVWSQGLLVWFTSCISEVDWSPTAFASLRF